MECLWHENKTGNKVDRRQAKGSHGEGQIRTKRSDFWAGQHMSSVPVSGRQRQVPLHEFDASLFYTANKFIVRVLSLKKGEYENPTTKPITLYANLKINLNKK